MTTGKLDGTRLSGRRKGSAWLLLASLVSLTLAVMLAWSPAGRGESAGAATVASALATPAMPAVKAGASMAGLLPEQIQLDVRWHDLGPRLIAAGAIDARRFEQLYADTGRPLSATQKAILLEGSDEHIVIDMDNAHFLLNFFWAVGLANQNPVLTEGPLWQASEGNIGRFASTGGWTLGSRPAAELYARLPLIRLTPDQQARLEAVATNVYRPCCDNHTAFADCNHGMAMLGLLELLASQETTVAEMFATAKAVNRFWFPQPAMETALFFKAAMNLDYVDVDPWMAVGPEVFSGSGFQQVHRWLAENELLSPTPGGGGSCSA